MKFKYFLLAVFFTFSSTAAFAQEMTPKLKENAIYGSVGVGGLYFTATGYYERIINQKSKLTQFIKVGTGVYALWGQGGPYLFGQYGILTGKKKHHLELGIGPNVMLDGDLQGELPISATAGWRIQKPGSHFMFRMGASLPEAVYVSLGVSFYSGKAYCSGSLAITASSGMAKLSMEGYSLDK